MRENQSPRRAQSNAARGVITKVYDDKGVQRVDIKVTKGETHSKVERFQQAGLTTNPPVGSEAAIVYLGGNRTHPVVVAVENHGKRKRNLKPGGAALQDTSGSGVEITTESDALNINSNGKPLKIRFSDGAEMSYSSAGISIKRGAAEVTMTDAAVLLKNGLSVSVTPTRVDLGGPSGQRVATEGGLSTKVFAIL